MSVESEEWKESLDLWILDKLATRILRQRIFTTLPSDHETLDEDEEALENYFAPKRNVVSKRHKIRSDTYLTALRELSDVLV